MLAKLWTILLTSVKEGLLDWGIHIIRGRTKIIIITTITTTIIIIHQNQQLLSQQQANQNGDYILNQRVDKLNKIILHIS